MNAEQLSVVPAKAGTQGERRADCPWVPAFAGTTKKEWLSLKAMCVSLRALLLALFALVASPSLAGAAGLEELVQQLGSDDFQTKIQAVDALGAAGDARAVGVLRALADGALYTTAENKLVIAEPGGAGFKIFDPIDRSALGEAAEDALEKVRVNNRLRGAIDAALGSLTLFSDDPALRFGAAQEALKQSPDDGGAALAKALAGEKVPYVRDALSLALAAARLRGHDRAAQLAALPELAKSSDPQVRNLLTEQRDAAAADPELKHAIDQALGAVEGRLKIVGAALTIFEGLSLGSILLLAAIGLAITFGVMGVINMAHGEMIMLGAYSTFVVQELFRAFLPPQWIDAYLVVSVPVAFLVTGAVGIGLDHDTRFAGHTHQA